MINITTNPDIRLYINDTTKWITVAKGFNKTISFSSTLPPIQSPIADLLINAANTINNTIHNVVATSTSAPFSENQDYNYEVITPKVVYQRIDNSTRVIFIDVTRLDTYSHLHNIVTTNTEWMQNPDLIRGRILIQKADSLGVFAPADIDNQFPDIVGSFSLGSQIVLDNLSTNTCLYRAIYEIRLIPNCGGTSPLVFQAIGDEFEFKSYFYKIPSPYATVVGEENKYLHFLDTTTNTDYVTSEIDKVFTVNIDSSNIDYKYAYTTSFTGDLPVSNVDYFVGDKKIEGSFDVITSLFETTITFEGTEKQFINGILIDTVNPFDETKSIWLEGVRPTALFEQVACSYNELLEDTTVVDNPHWVMRGLVSYEIYNEDTEEWDSLVNLNKLGLYTIKNCSLGEYRIRNRFTLRAIPNCGGTSPIIFQTDWYEYLYEVLEYAPLLNLPISNCCYTINEPITITPLAINLNNNSCPVPVVYPNEIKYQLYSYNRTTRLYDLVTETTITVVEPIVLTAYNFVFTPIILTHYKLVTTLSNCCVKVVNEEYYNLCEAVRVSNDTCNIYKFENVSLTDTYTYEIKNVITNVVFRTANLAPLVNTSNTLPDGIYTFTFTNNTTSEVFIKVVYVYCTIEACYIKSIKDLLCTIRNCKDCKSVEDIKKIAELNEFRQLYQAWMKSIEVDYRLKISYTIVDVNSKLTEFQDNDKLYKTLLQYCEPCNKQIEDCGC